MSERPLRVLVSIDTLTLGGGAERLVVRLVPHLARRGIECELAVFRRIPGEIGGELPAGTVVHRPAARSPRQLHRIATTWWLADVLARGRFDVVWGHMFHGNVTGVLAGQLRRVPSVVSLHGSAQAPTTMGSRARGRLEAEVGARATARVAVSRATAETYRARYGWSDVGVVYNGVPMDELRVVAGLDPSSLRAELGVEAGRPLLVLPGRLVRLKGHDEALVAMHALADLRPILVCIGQGPRQAELEAEAKAKGLTVRFLGTMAQPLLFRWLRAADCVVLPSHDEAFGLAAVEAMAVGTPTVVTRIGGFVEVVGDSAAAAVVEAGDGAGLAVAVRALLGARGAVLREAGPQRAPAFDILRCADGWATVLRRAAG